MTLVIRLLAIIPAGVAAICFMAAGLGYSASQIPPAPIDAYVLMYLGIVLGSIFLGIASWMTSIARSELTA